MVRVLIVDSNRAEDNAQMQAQGRASVGVEYGAALVALRPDLSAKVMHPYEGDTNHDVTKFDGVVFTGSAVEWNTDDVRAEPLAQVMRACFAAGVPVIGSCNGMQLAASVLGGSSAASPNGCEDGMARNIRLTDAGRAHPMMAGRRNGYAVPCVHRDEVVRLPEGAVLLAGNAHSPVQAFAYARDGAEFWGMQYHPELDPAPLGRALGDEGRISAQDAADMQCVATDEAAAARLGTTCAEQRLTEGRAVELRNWLDRF